MSFSATTLLSLFTGYLLFLFGIAFAAEKEWIPKRVSQNPYTHMLSMGIYASVWTFYGAFAMVGTSGTLFLSSYLGGTAAFILAPILFIPIFNITNRYKLSSIADLFAFRFRSGLVGTTTSILLLVAMLPFMSIQIQAIAQIIHQLNSDFSTQQIAAVFCTLIALFAILFGTRHPSMRMRNRGLVVAIATNSVIKLLVLLGIAVFLLFTTLGGPAASLTWVNATPAAISIFQQGDDSESWRTLLLAFFSSAIIMPHMFHMAFTENHSSDSLWRASWGIPLYLLLLAVSVPLIVLAGFKLGLEEPSSFLLFEIGQQLQNEWIVILTFLGGLSAASGMLIVASISFASMLQNHLIIPMIKTPENIRFYTWLLWLRRILISMVVFLSYAFYTAIGENQQPQLSGISAAIAFLQFLPGLIATLFWPRANRYGFMAGLIGGMLTWSMTTFHIFFGSTDLLSTSGLDAINWESSAILSLMVNVFALVLVSRITRTGKEEIRAGEACLIHTVETPQSIKRPSFEMRDIVRLLSPSIGANAARRELRHAINRLGLDRNQIGPLDLLRLRSALEHNLSSLIGPVKAATLLEPLTKSTEDKPYKTRDIHLLESHLETYQARLSGLAVELDELRRYHRTTLEKLPIGACTVTPSQHIVFWNNEMMKLTGLSANKVNDLSLQELPEPWNKVLPDFINQVENHLTEIQVSSNQQTYWLTLHKSQLSDKPDSSIVILVEDETENHLLAHRMTHNERLASIGRFSAGVAHEIGNPVTGIACLAQNLSFETDNPEVLQTGQQIVEQTQRITRIVQSLIRFSHTGQVISDIEFAPVNLKGCVEEAIHLVQLDSLAKQQNIKVSIDEQLTLSGDFQLLLQVFVNLLNNACDASEPNTEIHVEAREMDAEIALSITDEGHGIPEDIQHQLFEPFFTTKEPGKGTGLGLPLVYNILSEHYASIEVISPANNKQNKGTKILITLPSYTVGSS